jgi:G6PDH family F420-dependent oxidoreductase
MRIGLFLSSEEYGPHDLLEQARLAEAAGFESLWISDHFHPWNHAQGQSPFVWSMIGALATTTSLPIMTAVTCPTVRTHPAVIAQAAATCAVLSNGRFALGIGTGEALNEHITGDPWPPWDIRAEMLVEAVDLIRRLWTGEVVTHRGPHYTLDSARIFTLPDEPPEIHMSAFGPKALALAAAISDGFVTTTPDADAVERFREMSTRTTSARAGAKACYAASAMEGREMARRLWFIDVLPGELCQILPTPEHFEQAGRSVTTDDITAPCGPDPEPYVAMVQAYEDAGFDELNIAPIGPHYRELIELLGEHVIAR